MLVDWVQSQGGHAIKGATNFDTGFPDRIIYLKDAHAYVEVKGTSTRYHLNEKQKIWAGRILASGANYYILESLKGLEYLKEDIYVAGSTYQRNIYRLNGKNLVLIIHEASGTLEVNRLGEDGSITRLLSSAYPRESHDKVIYRVLSKLEGLYPNVNYEDM